MNLDLAVALREPRGEWLLPDVLAQQVGLSPAGLRAALSDLRSRGFRIEVRPGGAMRLTAAPEALEARQIAHRLGTRLVGGRVTVEAETASTNDLAWAALEVGGPEGECFLAEHQTRGRGRQGRRWFAPPGQALLLSVGLRPTPVHLSPSGGGQGQGHVRSDQKRPTLTHASPWKGEGFGGSALTFAASVAAVEGIAASTGLSCAIEWPNDITLGDRKVAGILVEGRLAGPARAFVVGLGLNANVPVGALPPGIRETATSLAEECGRAVDRVVLARHLILALDRWYGALRTGRLAAVQARWLGLSATVGHRLCLLQDGRRFEGEVVSVSPTEGLALRLNHGEVRFFQADSATVVSRPMTTSRRSRSGRA